MSGWICSYRKIWDNEFFRGRGMRVAVWHWILHHAAYDDTTHTIGTAEISVRRGEVCFSQQQICDETGASRKQVRDVLDFLISSGNATKIRANDRAKGGAKVGANARTMLVIEKYDEYQAKPKQGANGRAKGGAKLGPTKETREQQNKDIPVGKAANAASPEPAKIDTVASAAWAVGKAYLAKHGVKNPGAVVGSLMKDAGSPADLMRAVEASEKSETQDPIPYIRSILKASGKPYRRQQPQEREGYTNAGAFGMIKEVN